MAAPCREHLDAPAAQHLHRLRAQCMGTRTARIAELERAVLTREDPVVQYLLGIPGIDLLPATALRASMPTYARS